MSAYCRSRVLSLRRKSRVVAVGDVAVGGDNPIRVQSMTNTPTLDIEATVAQSIALAEAGSELVRITAPNVKAAKALGEIRKRLREAGVRVPLVADIHFMPQAAIEAAEHVEKVRINPGNFADRKKFAVKEYSDTEYEEELQRLYDGFSPLVRRCKELGRAMRIGTNHGSLSDRIMNRYGDSPEGMVESALEYLRIAESHGYKDIILSMKASNPRVMIQANRLLVKRMAEEDMNYPLHLGVTEAGDGDDARIKSAAGIGSLLVDGVGDTIRVSLTEDPVAEIPVAQTLARKAMRLWSRCAGPAPIAQDGASLAGKAVEDAPAEPCPETVDFYHYNRREVIALDLGRDLKTGPLEPPAVIVRMRAGLAELDGLENELLAYHAKRGELPAEGLLISLDSLAALPKLATVRDWARGADGGGFRFIVLESAEGVNVTALLQSADWPEGVNWFVLPPASAVAEWITSAGWKTVSSALSAVPQNVSLCLDGVPFLASGAEEALAHLKASGIPAERLFFTASAPYGGWHPAGTLRQVAAHLDRADLKSPLWIRCSPANFLTPAVASAASTGTPASPRPDRLLENALRAGSLLADGRGDLISVETEPDPILAARMAMDILQGVRARISKTEYVACPSCGRTLFDLQSTTQRIRERTSHLKGVTIAVMGCIVNGPGEMADADFGYVGGAPQKVNLYVGKSCVQTGIPEAEAVERLIGLIQEHGKWVDP